MMSKREMRSTIKNMAKGLAIAAREVDACVEMMVDAQTAYEKLEKAAADLSSRANDIAKLADALAYASAAAKRKAESKIPCVHGCVPGTPAGKLHSRCAREGSV